MQALSAEQPQTTSVRERVGRTLTAFLEIDFTKPLPFAVLAIAYVASRAYWLDLGYGTDPDAWRVALVADYLWKEGEYLPSRLPGYPLHELTTALFIKGGWIATNLSTVLASLAGVYMFAWLARRLDIPNAGALTIGFAFAPLLWINSVQTMDYMWALTFVLGSYVALTYNRPSVAGVVLGIAAGFRPTSLFMLPIFWLLLLRTGQRSQLRPLTLSTIATSLLAFLPVILTYGVNFMNFYDQQVHVEEFIKRLGKDGLGIIGVSALAIALLLSLPRLVKLPRDLVRDAHVLVWCTAILVLFTSYTRLPHEIGYLLPLFPFGFFLMARYMSRGVLVFALVAILSAGWVDLTSPDDTVGIDSSTFTSTRVGRGMLLSDIDTLQNQMDFADEVRETTAGRPDIRKPAVVIVGFIYPELAMLYEDQLDIGILEEDETSISQLSDKGQACDPTCERQPDIEYVWLLEYEQFQQYLDEARTIYYTADAARSTYAVHGYRPAYFGARELPLSRENPSLGAGTATSDR